MLRVQQLWEHVAHCLQQGLGSSTSGSPTTRCTAGSATSSSSSSTRNGICPRQCFTSKRATLAEPSQPCNARVQGGNTRCTVGKEEKELKKCTNASFVEIPGEKFKNTGHVFITHDTHHDYPCKIPAIFTKMAHTPIIGLKKPLPDSCQEKNTFGCHTEQRRRRRGKGRWKSR